MPQGRKDKTNTDTKSANKQRNIKNNTNVEKGTSKKNFCDFPIVGIGASAGGLTAFKDFFSGMPEDTEPNMAFVVIQHLDPDHKSALSEIIRRYTSMKVVEAEDGMRVQRNYAYIIPPNYSMTFIDGTLQLKEPSAPRGQRMPIDKFFRSLARDQRERAICVILSGTGSDGTLGLRAIKGQGGMAMVQRLESSRYKGMPQSAIDTGLVDYILPPAEMPEQLMAYNSHAFEGRDQSVSQYSGEKQLLKKIFITLRNQTGHDFSQYKTSTIHRRIKHRMSVQQIETMDRYVKYLQQTSEEVEKLFRSLLIGVTSFFRDPEAFKVLKKDVIPVLFADNRDTGLIRIWTPGCSTGEEAYSIAILIAEYQEKVNKSYKVQIFATDIDSNAIATARQGLFPAGIVDDIKPEKLSRFFKTKDNGKNYRIQKRIREMVIFSEQNIIEDPPFSRLDLISCRNLLIYMNSELQKKIISLFRYALNPGGFLFLGTSESLGESHDFFSPIDSKLKLYQLKKDVKNSQLGTSDFLTSMKPIDVERPPLAATSVDNMELTLRELTEQKILEQFVPAAVLVTGYGEILYIHGHTGLYLEPSPGIGSVNNILKMARDGLQSKLTTALHESKMEQKKVFCPKIYVKSNSDITAVNLTVCPVKSGSSSQFDEILYLVVFEQVSPSEQKSAEQVFDLSVSESEDSYETDAESIIADLRQKLQAKEESLQNTVEELQTANEELKSSNEELQAVNEELQSTNEELETSKEELQSLNEELKTVNAELETKVTDLTQANTDMNNLLSGTGIGTIFVDLDLNIMRFTPSATKFINLIESDIGRPVDHIVSNMVDYDYLSEDLQEVLDTLVPKEIEVQVQDGKWYMLRIQPYRTMENVIKGAVLTFRDISEKKQLTDKLSKVSRLFARQMVAVIREPLLVLDNDLRVVATNNAFYDKFQITPEDIRGQSLFEMENGHWDISALRKLLTEGLDQTTVVHDYQIIQEYAPIGRRVIRINARRVLSETGSSGLILLSLEEIRGSAQNRTDKEEKVIPEKKSGGEDVE